MVVFTNNKYRIILHNRPTNFMSFFFLDTAPSALKQWNESIAVIIAPWKKSIYFGYKIAHHRWYTITKLAPLRIQMYVSSCVSASFYMFWYVFAFCILYTRVQHCMPNLSLAPAIYSDVIIRHSTLLSAVGAGGGGRGVSLPVIP
jgi:hypothetical protein